MRAEILGAAISMLLMGCTTEWQTNIDKQQVEQDGRLRTIEDRLKDHINSTQELIKEQNKAIEGLELKLDELQRESAQAPSPVNLAGKWVMAGPYNAGMPCEIIQSAKSLVFVNESGHRSDGWFEGESTVVAVGWDGLKGEITENASRIIWRNGTWWNRAKP